MKRQSSYQKVKAENAKLRSDLRELAANPSSERSILIKMCEIYQQRFEEMVWHGSVKSVRTNKFGGFVNLK